MDVWFEGVVCVSSLSTRRLLDDVSGRFLSGEVTAILGHSGAGKTTLLNAISGYRRIGITGAISEGTREQGIYIGQEDLLAPMVTAGELMEFAARIKLPGTTASKRKTIVEELMSNLGLDEVFNTRTERMSGGQRRRLSIALELVNNPTILFLDEPTSGLDTVSTVQLIQLLSKLSRGGRTIVCTIHQPSATLFDLFDRVYFMAAGKCVYQGGPGKHLINYLAAHDFVCPIHYNPADFVIEVTENLSNIDELSRASKNGKISWYSAEGVTSTVPVPEPLKSKQLSEDKFEDTRLRPSFWLQYLAIFSKMMLQINRNKHGLWIQLIHHIGCSLIIGSLFYNSGNDGEQPFNQVKFLVTVIVFYTYTQSIINILQFPFEVKILKRDCFNRWYSIFPYYLAHTAVKSCYMIPLTLLFVIISYLFSGLPLEWHRFSLFFLVGIITSATAEGFGLVIGTIFSVENGSMVGPCFLAPLFGFAIYGIDFSRQIGYLTNFLLRTSFMRAARNGLFLVSFGFNRAKMDCPAEKAHCIFNDPKVYLYHLNLEQFSVLEAVGDLILNLCFYRLAFYLALKWRIEKKS